MEYTVHKLCGMAGISARTLRYYDEIGLLKPLKVSASGYRVYGGAEVDALQQILFYRELGFALETIRDLVSDPAFDGLQALTEHRRQLLKKRDSLNTLIKNVDKTIKAAKGNTAMSDKEKFEGFNVKMIDENEKKYGKEICEKYGDEIVDQSNQKVKNLSQKQHEEVTALCETLMAKLAEAKAQGDPRSPLAQEAADLHRQWLCYFWPVYTKQAHAGVAQMYVDDERFTAYYDKDVPGTAQFLRDAVRIYTGMGE